MTTNVTFRSNPDVAISVPDLAQAEAFYGDVLGFPLASKTDTLLEFDTGTIRLWVNKAAQPQSFVPSLDVTDVEAAKQRLEAAGCKILRSGAGGLFFEDPFGFAIDVIKTPN